MPHYTKIYETGRVYGLTDPRTQEIKYVGATIRSLKKRMLEHTFDKKHEFCDRRLWVRDVQASGVQPEIFELEEVPFSDLAEAEKFWLGYFRMLGAKLTNTSDRKNTKTPYRIRFPKPPFEIKKSA